MSYSIRQINNMVDLEAKIQLKKVRKSNVNKNNSK